MATKKRSSARKKSTHSRAKSEMQSFRLAKDTIPFTSTRFTRQTFYWVVMLAVIVVLQIWIIRLQTEVGNLTNTIITLQSEQ